MRMTRTSAIALWLAFVFACTWIAIRGSYTADLSAFLPKNPTPEQQLLLDQLKLELPAQPPPKIHQVDPKA